jgi:hypothetical protein
MKAAISISCAAKARGSLLFSPNEVRLHQSNSRHARESGHPVLCGGEIEIEPMSRGVLDHPSEPVVGRRDAPTRWRMMTSEQGPLSTLRSAHSISQMRCVFSPA